MIIGYFMQIKYEVYKAELGDKRFKPLNQQLQALFLFYIDGASFISEDEDWSYFMIY